MSNSRISKFLQHLRDQREWYFALPVCLVLCLGLIYAPFYITGRQPADDLTALVSLAPALVALVMILAFSFLSKDHVGTNYVGNKDPDPLARAVWSFAEVFLFVVIGMVVLVSTPWTVVAALLVGFALIVAAVALLKNFPPPILSDKPVMEKPKPAK